MKLKNGEAEALIEFNSNDQIKFVPKIYLKSYKTSKNVHDQVPCDVGPTSCIWNFTKFQIELWKLIKPLFGLRFKLFNFKNAQNL